jgi:hypothetical protein
VIPADVPGVARSRLPRARPKGDLLAQSIANAVALSLGGAPGAANTGADDTAPVPAGEKLVQFGAYDSPDIAREAWAALEARFGDFLAGKRRVVQEASSGGTTFYRLRAMGFADLNDARRFCSTFVAERQACIPVVVR